MSGYWRTAIAFRLRRIWDQLFNGDVPLGEEHDEGWWI